MDSAKTVTATFTVSSTTNYTLTVTAPTNGKITSSAGGIDCGTACTANYSAGTKVTLTAVPVTGYQFDSWSGACSGTTTATCEVTMNAAKTVSATFKTASAQTYTLTVTAPSNGKVMSNTGGIDCGTSCTASYDSGTKVTLTAAPTSGYQLDSWGGACSGATTTTCEVTMDSAKTVSVTFKVVQTPTNYTLSITAPSNGKITSNTGGIDCGTTCSASYASGTKVTLTATPNTGYVFSSWGGACSGTTVTCEVTIDSAKNVTATFGVASTPTTFNLTVTKTGTGSGSVKGTGIDCGTDCADSYAKDVKVTLTAAPESGSTFIGWGDACTGTNVTCEVTMDNAKSVSATFNTSN